MEVLLMFHSGFGIGYSLNSSAFPLFSVLAAALRLSIKRLCYESALDNSPQNRWWHETISGNLTGYSWATAISHPLLGPTRVPLQRGDGVHFAAVPPYALLGAYTLLRVHKRLGAGVG
ncbi:hypothetical protein C8R45DRAFT_1096625 [Mycena sanguinolenta]|nr:hypothetical protein C8R45DRAFT_1096625 [Mycena sanguinolenta]